MRIAGIDYGTVRIGIALADTEVGIASPFENYTRRSTALDARILRQLAKEERIGRFVVGLPVHLHGGESQKSTEARAFGEWLGEVTGVPVEYFDERFTTAEADEFWARRSSPRSSGRPAAINSRRRSCSPRISKRAAAGRTIPAQSIRLEPG